MPRKGIVVDYDYCTGCHTCEVACQQEHDYPPGKCGIHLVEILTKLPDKKLRLDYLPFFTAYCDLCAARTAKGELPSCVKHCQASVMTYGTLPQLAELMEKKPHCILQTPR